MAKAPLAEARLRIFPGLPKHARPGLAILAGFFLCLPAQAQDLELYEWTATVDGSQTGSWPAGVALDPSGNAVVTGHFERLPSGQGLALAKFKPSGEMLWQRTSGGSGKTSGQSVASDRSGNTYVLGRFRDTLILDGKEYVSRGEPDLFLSKYDSSGNSVLFNLIQGGASGVWPLGVAVDSGGNPTITGTTGDTVVIGKDTLRPVSSERPLQFLTRYASGGAVEWTLQPKGSPRSFYMQDMIAMPDGGLALSGVVTGRAELDGVVIGGTGLDSADGMPFIVLVSKSGRVQWVKQFKGIRGGSMKGFGRDDAGNLYFSAQIQAAKFLIEADTVRIPTGSSYLLAKVDDIGRLIWHRTLPVSGSHILDGLGVGGDGSVFLKARIASRVYPTQFMTYTLDTKGIVTDVIAKFDAQGNFRWHTQIPENVTILQVNPLGGVAVDRAGNAYVLGHFHDKKILNSKAQDSVKYRLFLAKIGQDRQAGILARFSGKWKLFDPKFGKGLYSVDYLKDRFYAGGPGLIVSSRDGASWQVNQNYSVCSVFGFAYDNKGNFFAGGSNGALLQSTDGSSWQEAGHTPVASIFDLAWAGGRFLAVGEYGNIMHSADGLDWMSSSWQSGFSFYSIAYADSFAVAVGTKGNIYTSSNGTQWTKQVSGTDADLYGVAWNGSAFVAVGDIVLSSPDGKTWTRHPSVVPSILQAFFAVEAIQGEFVAVGENGRISYSRTGSDWRDEDFPCDCRLNDISANDSQVVVVVDDGRILLAARKDFFAASVKKSRSAPEAPRLLVRQSKGEGLDVEFHLETRMDIRLRAYDLSGRILSRYAEGQVGPGTHVRRIPFHRPHSGVYFLELTSNRGKTIRRAWK